MIKSLSLFVCALLFGVTSPVYAGFFSSEPDAAFKSLDVMATYGTNSYTYSFTVGAFTDAYKGEAETRWDKDGDGWIFHVSKIDKMAGTKSKTAFRFQEVKGKGAMITRMVVDGENLSPAMIVNLMSQMDAAIGKPAAAPKSNKKK